MSTSFRSITNYPRFWAQFEGNPQVYDLIYDSNAEGILTDAER